MEDTVNILRESRRNLLIINRRGRREKELDTRRSVTIPENFNKENILNIANKLKTKSLICIKELSYLKNSFSEDAHFVEIFLGVHGALRGLIRELTGSSGQKQVCACECVCNMTVWSDSITSVVARAAVAYLHTALHSFNKEIQITSAWCLGNISCGGHSSRLVALGSHTKLLAMLDKHADEEATDAALYATAHTVLAMGDTAPEEYVHRCIEVIMNRELSLQTSQLLFFLSCTAHFMNVIDVNVVKYITTSFAAYLESHISKCNDIKEYICCEMVYMLRSLANIFQASTSVIILDILTTNNCFDSINKILLDPRSKDYCLWFLGNVYNFAPDSELKMIFFNNLTSQ